MYDYIEELKPTSLIWPLQKVMNQLRTLIFRVIFETIEQCGNAESFEQKMKTQI
jgi:hypothetical protein